MKARLLLLAVLVGLLVAAPFLVPAAANGRTATGPIYLDTQYSFAERAADLVSRLTLAQKAGQMVSSVSQAIATPAISQYGWWNEAAHGVMCESLNNSSNCTNLTNTTSYPVALSMAASWDPPLIHETASLISDEAREVETNNTQNMGFYAPVINLIRDPRWGRSDETWSEDPYLEALEAGQFVNGLQGQDQNGNLIASGAGPQGFLKAIATIKHYTANNSEVNRRQGGAEMDDRTLREYYTMPYRDIAREAHVGSIMSSYNTVAGPCQFTAAYCLTHDTPSPASVYLNDTLARETFGFQGFFTSDCDAIEVMSADHHWIPPGQSTQVTQTTRHAWALAAGEDLDCQTGYNDGQSYRTQLVNVINANLTLPTGRVTENQVDTSLERLYTARMQLGEFDNGGNDVPWVQQARARVPQGTWQNNAANMAVTETAARLAAARDAGDKSIVLLKNAPVSGTKLLPLQVPATGPFHVAVVGYFANPATMYLGDYSSTQTGNGQLNQVNGFIGLKNAIQAINPTAVVDWCSGVVGGTSASQLTTVDPACVNSTARIADVVIVYVGTDSSTGQEDHDRTNISLPGAQASLISQVAAVNPKTIVYMETDGCVDVTGFEPAVPAMLWSSFNGQRKGESLADVVLGSYNPSGHLPFTWYQTNAQLPAITDYSIRPNGTNPGRTYMYFTGAPKYPFGYGLSYTTFSYGNLQIDDATPDANDTIHVSADVTNTGTRAGNEVVQLYASTPDADAALERPIKRLHGFQKVSLNPGQTKTVTFTLKVADLAFYDQTLGRWVVDDGRHTLQVGDSSADANLPLSGDIQVSGAITPVPSVVTAKPTMPSDAAMDIPQRLFFPSGVVVQPNLTISMNDDTLYGYVTKGQSTPFPNGLTFQFSSNRPSVVFVAGDGTIHTVSQGVATVTATVTYNSVSKSTDFVVYVNSGPTAVTVASFNARRSGRGVLVTWRTASEAGLVGFNLYRGQTKLSRALIAAKRAGSTGGASYRFVDRTARAHTPYRYRLQLVDRSGKRSWAPAGAFVR